MRAAVTMLIGLIRLSVAPTCARTSAGICGAYGYAVAGGSQAADV